MKPLRAEEITLFCEDKPGGRSQRILDAAVSELRGTLPFAGAIRTIGVLGKNDVVVRAKFARSQTGPKLRVLAVRDRDFLRAPLVTDARAHAYDSDWARVTPWPLSRHCIESYLLDDDVLDALPLASRPTGAQPVIDRAAAARQWLDVTRGTLDDLAYRVRQVRQTSILEPPSDRETAIAAVQHVATAMQRALTDAGAPEALTKHLDALAADMSTDGPLRHRVDGRELVYDVERALGRHRGSLLDALSQQARKKPPAALVAEMKAVLEAMPANWRTTGD